VEAQAETLIFHITNRNFAFMAFITKNLKTTKEALRESTPLFFNIKLS
jgi:ubiquinone/menaquinone biosynthesis C-methylase UbiE